MSLETGSGQFKQIHRRGGYTLTELLVVMSAIILILAVIVPSVKNLLSARRVDAGVQTLSAATAAIRGYAGLRPPFGTGKFQGIALVFSPSGEMRLTEHFPAATDGGGSPLVDRDPPSAGYRDILGATYVKLPPGVGVLGISRGGNFADPETEYLAPPFAVRFDKNGAMIVRKEGSNADGSVYYDGNYDNKYFVTKERGNVTGGYEPEKYDPDSRRFDPANMNAVEGKINFAFEKLESVVGVLFYSKKDFWKASSAYELSSDYVAGSLVPDKWAPEGPWLIDPTKGSIAALFNRYTGAVISP